MKLSTKGRYAVMAMVDLALHSKGRPITLADIASRQEISLSYLEQLFSKLRAGGFVDSVRGPGGGYKLASSEEDICIADIVLSVDESLNQTRCQNGENSEGCSSKGGRCLTHDLWDELGRQIYLYLSSVSLGDVVHKRIVKSGLQSVQPASSEQPSPEQEVVSETA